MIMIKCGIVVLMAIVKYAGLSVFMFDLFAGFGVFGWIVFSLLMILSVISWFIIYTKSIVSVILKKEFGRVGEKWKKLQGFNQISAFVQNDNSVLTQMLVTALFEWPKINMAQITELQKSELLFNVLDKEIIRIRMHLDRGQTLLAVIASVSPFIGLLGTVVGIFSTLTDISQIQNPSLALISGSIGETLIMTAFGLVVAIPAVFAYNIFAKFNRNSIIRIKEMAKSYHTLIVYKLKNDDF